MEQRVGMEDLLRRIRREIRRRRAEFYGLRGAFWGGMAGLVVLLVKQGVGGTAPWVAGGLVLVGALAGLVYGAARRIDRLDTARVADRAFGLHDRVATTLEWAERADRTPLVEALVADTRARVEALQMKRVVRHELPREARFLPLPLLACLVLALMPPIPMPSGRFPDMLSGGEEDREDRTRSTMLEETTRALTKDALKRSFEERDFAQRAGGSGATTAGDLSAIFKDTSLANARPDFNSFMKKGDERLRMLEQTDRMPDLQSDFTNSQYKMVYRKSKALTGGLRPDQISPQKLRELLEEMERLGRKGGGNWSGDAMEGMEALEGGQSDRALEAMQKALDKMRAMDEAQRSGKGLRGGRESERGGRGKDRARGDGMGPEDQDFGEGEGLMPGKG